MLEIQVVQRSRSGVVIPVARDDSPDLVRHVVKAILRKMETWQFDDEVLDEFARREREAFSQIVEWELGRDGNGCVGEEA